MLTSWEQEENEKSFFHLHSLQTQKIYWGHAEPSHWLHAIFIFKIVGHIFWPRLMVATKKLWDNQILEHILGVTYCDLHQLHGSACNVHIFFLAMIQFDWLGHHPNFQTVKGLQNTGFDLEAFHSSPWLRCIAERRTTFAKAYRIKVRCYWKHIGNKKENETRIVLNNLSNRVLRKTITCQHWFLP